METSFIPQHFQKQLIYTKPFAYLIKRTASCMSSRTTTLVHWFWPTGTRNVGGSSPGVATMRYAHALEQPCIAPGGTDYITETLDHGFLHESHLGDTDLHLRVNTKNQKSA